jgi:hypothetical protein
MYIFIFSFLFLYRRLHKNTCTVVSSYLIHSFLSIVCRGRNAVSLILVLLIFTQEGWWHFRDCANDPPVCEDRFFERATSITYSVLQRWRRESIISQNGKHINEIIWKQKWRRSVERDTCMRVWYACLKIFNQQVDQWV